jgi:hypothetical protein
MFSIKFPFLKSEEREREREMESKTKAINPSRLESFFDDDYKQQDHIVCIDFFFFFPW